MCWTGAIIGAFVGFCIGVVVAGIMSAAKRSETKDQLSETPIDNDVMDEIEEVPCERLPHPKPETYFDRYPHS